MHAYIYIYVYCKIYLIYIYIATHCIIIHTVIFLQTLLMNCLFGVYSVALTHNRRGVGESPVASRSQEQLFDSQRALSDARRALSALGHFAEGICGRCDSHVHLPRETL